ncbi:hypothetical protein E2C01_068492 [Portunus trituberculatus]|uniref:Uncharacterized protein n=1 Tax=Portunus trituberculatus TaxID=210409 RepID=A0A5B7HW05_PORTR|nr:hypothetical protein [Portunus trituberculatus]
MATTATTTNTAATTATMPLITAKQWRGLVRERAPVASHFQESFIRVSGALGEEEMEREDEGERRVRGVVGDGMRRTRRECRNVAKDGGGVKFFKR